MESSRLQANSSFSPSVSATLMLHDHRFAVAALGRNYVVLRYPELCAAGVGTIEMTIDGRRTTYAVFLPQGVHPERRKQPHQLQPDNQPQPASA